MVRPIITSRRSALLVGLAAGYFLTGKLGLLLAFYHPSATAIWPPTGIALAAMLILGYSAWPAIFCGAFPVNVTTAGSLATAAGIAVGNTLEGLVIAVLAKGFARGAKAFDRSEDTVTFTLVAMIGTVVSPTIGVGSLLLGGYANWENVGFVWLTWWLGDMAGALIVTPLLVLWSVDSRVHWSRLKVLKPPC